MRVYKLISLGVFAQIFAFAIICSQASAFAQQPMPAPAKDYSSLSEQELQEELLALSDDSDPCSVNAPLLREAIARRPELVELGDFLLLSELRCAANRESFGEALEYYLRLEDKGFGLSPNYGLYLARRTDSAERSVDLIERILMSGDAEKLASLRNDAFWRVERLARRDGISSELDKVSEEAVREGALKHLDRELGSDLARSALKSAGLQGDARLVQEALKSVYRPNSFVRLLSAREYEPIWPAIEERVGKNFTAITEEFRADTLKKFDRNREDLESLHSYVRALHYDGDFEAVVDAVDAAITRDDIVSTIQIDEAWSLNLKGYALDALGRASEADEVFELLAASSEIRQELGPSFLINRAARLVGHGKWEQGLAAAEAAWTMAESRGNAYARSLTLRDRICALKSLGRENESRTLLDQLRLEAEDRPAILAEGLLCLGFDDEAALLLTRALDNETTRRVLVTDLQHGAMNLFETSSVLRKPRDLVREHSGLRQKFLEFARFVPEEFYPAASQRRSKADEN